MGWVYFIQEVSFPAADPCRWREGRRTTFVFDEIGKPRPGAPCRSMSQPLLLPTKARVLRLVATRDCQIPLPLS